MGLTAGAGAAIPAVATPPTALPVFQRLLVLENAGWEASLLAEAGVERAQAEAWLLGPSCLGELEENAKHPPLRLLLADLRGACCANLLGRGRLAEAALVAEACLRPGTGTRAASGRWEAFVALGEVLAARGELHAAEERLEEAASAARKGALPGLELFGLGKLKALVLEPLGRQAEADRRLEEAAKRIPKDGKPLAALGELLAPAAETRAKKLQEAA